MINVGREWLDFPHSRLPFSIPSSERINSARRFSRTSSWGSGVVRMDGFVIGSGEVCQ
jgi:hypothetical protein